MKRLTNDTPMMIADVARLLHMTTNGVRYFERRGRLPAIRTTTGVRLFMPEDVERFRAERERGKVVAGA